MTPDRAALVRESWARLAPGRDVAVHRFRDRLQSVSPRTAAAFECLDDPIRLDALLAGLDSVIAATASDEDLVPAMARVARRFQGYGPAPGEYLLVRDVLLDVIADLHGEEAPAELRHAWGELFILLAALVDRASRLRA